MRDYGKVHTSFWSSEDMRVLTDDGRLLALYLITSPHSTIAGVFRLPDGYVCEDLQWSGERVAKGFAELFAKGFANRCGTTKWVWVCKHLEWNPPENPNQRKSAAKVATGVPDECSWKPAFMRVCGPLLDLEPWTPPNPPPTVPEPFLNQKQKQEQEQELFVPPGTATPDPQKAAARTPPSRFPEFWAAWPSTDRKSAKSECLKRWKSKELDPLTDEILAHIEACKRTRKWQDGYEPAPLTYLNRKLWEDGTPATEQHQATFV